MSSIVWERTVTNLEDICHQLMRTKIRREALILYEHDKYLDRKIYQSNKKGGFNVNCRLYNQNKYLIISVFGGAV